MVDFARSAATAQRLVEANGRAIVIAKRNRAPADASKPWRGSSAAPTDAGEGDVLPSVVAAFVPAAGSAVGSGAGFGSVVRDVLGPTTVDLDQVALVASGSVGDVDLGEYDEVRDRGRVWRIVRSGELRPGDVSILWVLGLKA